MTLAPPIAPKAEPKPLQRGLILDRRRGLGWHHGLPQRLVTAGAWGGTGWLLGPLALKGLLIASLGGALGLPLLERMLTRRGVPASPLVPSRVGTTATANPQPWPGGLPRLQLAEAFGLPEVDLFRARHARICTVDHDDEGRIRAIRLPGPCLPQAHPDRDAHPVR